MVKHNMAIIVPAIIHPDGVCVKDLCLESIIRMPLKQGNLGEQRLSWNLSIMTCVPLINLL
jgi:hypothetical protein